MAEKKSAFEHVRKGIELWKQFSANEQHAVGGGIFPARLMAAAEAEGFDGHTLVVALMEIRRIAPKSLPLGRLLATPGALRFLAQMESNPLKFLARHATGDWGDLDAHDKRANEQALRDGSRVLSSYRIGNEKLWIITEADRSATTLLLPSEY